MKIAIKQSFFSFGDNYSISIGGEQKYTASSPFFYWPKQINLYAEPGQALKLRLQKNWGFSATSFDLTKDAGDVFKFRSKNFWKPDYSCQSETVSYEIYGHVGYSYSVFRNDIQVAWWEKNNIIDGGDTYTIEADSDCDYELIIGFCIIIDAAHSNSSSAGAIDLGNIGPESRKFDRNWRPK